MATHTHTVQHTPQKCDYGSNLWDWSWSHILLQKDKIMSSRFNCSSNSNKAFQVYSPYYNNKAIHCKLERHTMASHLFWMKCLCGTVLRALQMKSHKWKKSHSQPQKSYFVVTLIIQLPQGIYTIVLKKQSSIIGPMMGGKSTHWLIISTKPIGVYGFLYMPCLKTFWSWLFLCASFGSSFHFTAIGMSAHICILKTPFKPQNQWAAKRLSEFWVRWDNLSTY